MLSVPIDSNPRKQSGKVCIAGTRVPVNTLFNYLAIGKTIDNFIAEYPFITRRQAHDVVAFAGVLMVSDPHAVERAKAHTEELNRELADCHRAGGGAEAAPER